MPADRIVSSTVVAPVAADAGALATAFSVLTPDAEPEARRKNSWRGIFAREERDGAIVTSEGWAALESPRSPVSAESAPAPVFETVASNNIAPEWDPNYQLTIGISINLIQGFRVTRPCAVAVWIEDADGRPVRTIALWFNKFRFLHELQTWYGDQLLYRTRTAPKTLPIRFPAPPGCRAHTLWNWDGKDDAGNSVKPGKYRVFVEVSRELMHATVDARGYGFYRNSQESDLCPGELKIASAYFDYHKITH